MTTSAVDRIVAATLYEGYVLYPYRPTSVKNQVRWTFGAVHPRAYSEASKGTEPWMAQTECLLRTSDQTSVSVHVRFLQLVTRTVARVDRPATILSDDTALTPVPSLCIGDVTHRPWEEATERDVDAGVHSLPALLERAQRSTIALTQRRELEPLRDGSGAIAGALLREYGALEAEVEVSATQLGAGLTRVRVVVRNTADVEVTGSGDRERALRRSLISTHAILGAQAGTWLSLADPPDDARAAAAACSNVGLWPVLVGEPEVDDIILASPIILEDHPQVAPESAGELFDATEIDEILSLRILTLTDEEKAEMRSADERTRAMLERTEALTGDDLMRLHGTIRELRPVRGKRP